MAVELSFGSSVRVLKLDVCTNNFVTASYLCLLILSWRTAWWVAIPPWKLWFIQGGMIFTKYRMGSCKWFMIDTWDSWMLQNPADNPRLQTWNNAIQYREPSPWKHMLRREIRFFRQKWEDKNAFSSSLTLILEEKQDHKNTGGGLTSLDGEYFWLRSYTMELSRCEQMAPLDSSHWRDDNRFEGTPKYVSSWFVIPSLSLIYIIKIMQWDGFYVRVWLFFESNHRCTLDYTSRTSHPASYHSGYRPLPFQGSDQLWFGKMLHLHKIIYNSWLRHSFW